MFEEFETKKYFTNRPPPTDLTNYILVEKREMDDFRCGECDGTIIMSLYYSSKPRKYIKQFECSNCKIITWR